MFNCINGWTKELMKLQVSKRNRGPKAVNDGSGCQYRDKYGAACGVGCFIPDDIYQNGMEGLGAKDLIKDFPQVAPYLPLEVDALGKLQGKHDNCPFDKNPRQELLNWIDANVN